MQVNLGNAVNALNSADKKLRELATPADGKKSVDDALLDTVELSPGALQGGEIQSPTATQLFGELADQLAPLTDLIRGEAGRQKELGELFGDPKSAETIRSRAQELLEGYFSAENTAARIFNFAFSFFNGEGDREAFAREMKGNIDEGFRQAEKALGGLADISLETRDLIDQKIEAFIEGDRQAEDDAGELENQT